MRIASLQAVVLIAVAGLTAAARADEQLHWQAVSLTHGDRSYRIPVYASLDLAGDLSRIRHVVLVQHGIQRNADDYYASAYQLLQQSGLSAEQLQQVLLLAPKFLAPADLKKGFSDMPVWPPQGWPGGDEAISALPGLSAFSVYDELLASLLQPGRLPALQSITIAGHSAGAQLVQRYAILNSEDEAIRARGIKLHYVIANPSSFLYLDDQRPRLSKPGFGTDAATSCPDYNQYRYGLQQLPAYAQLRDGPALMRRFLQRQVDYLAGTADRDPNHPLLDKSCAAEAQGDSRLARAHFYWLYELQAAIMQTNRHSYTEVLGVAHQQSRMFGSVCGARLLFDAAATPAGAPTCTAVSSDSLKISE